jgi:hypothetical protein
MVRKWTALIGLAGLGLLPSVGCLGDFWRGVTDGWPGGSRWLALLVDVANEAVLG